MGPTKPLTDLLELSYDELESANLKARSMKDPKTALREHTRYLSEQKSIKTLTVCFTDIEGRLQTLDYDKEFLLKSLDNLTFDGSSIKGFSEQNDSDLRLYVDWTSLTFLPSDIFGAGKVLVFGLVYTRDLNPYESDFRGQLLAYTKKIKEASDLEALMAPELEGYLLDGIDAEKHYQSEVGFKLVSNGGYFNSLPTDDLRCFIEKVTQALRAMGFRNEKAHPEVGPSQFEIDYSYTDVLRACDQAQLYKLVCRQVAMNMGKTVSFLPKPIQGINGNGMHTNFSLAREGKNLFYQQDGEAELSKEGWDFTHHILHRAADLCLIFNSSVNSYRRLDPHFEAPNQIKASANDRGALIRIPFGNEHSKRLEIRAVSPDCNPYLNLYAILRTGLEDQTDDSFAGQSQEVRMLPATINEAIRIFESSDFITSILGKTNKDKYLALKQEVAKRGPQDLNSGIIENAEVLYHHEITNQYLWNKTA